jgi:alcohol dehydrogenase class IV
MDGFTIAPKPAAHVGAGAVGQLPAVVRATGADQVVVVTDAALAATPVIATVQAVLADAGIPARPIKRITLVAVGGGSPIRRAAARSTWATPARCPSPRSWTRT